jgi:plasmid maintenance system antidote protein VapI
MKATLFSELTRLKAKCGTWTEFEAQTGIPHSQISRIMSRDIAMTTDMAERLSKASRRSAKSWMLLWVDRWYDAVPVQTMHSREGSAPTLIAKE